MLDAAACVGSHDLLLITLDTLRYDVAMRALADGRTPFLAGLLARSEAGTWERRHTPGSFTWAAHQAFFAGFLPTPARPGPHPRLFAMAFPGSETTGPETATFDAPELVSGLRGRGYHTICVGGVGFFNGLTPLGSALPKLFDEQRWRPEFGVTEPTSTTHQVRWACERVAAQPSARRVFCFLNVSALHQPNCHYLPGREVDDADTQAAALAWVDGQLAPLFAALRQRAPLLAVVCSDHGTAYGEHGYVGHRLAHPTVWEVPYLELLLPRAGDPTP
ncbi:STM4013/SEN3800 family hydrolase [Pseudenhygromyxa sp. WMMC2535]|uniref:STM4013/SEN3800 family hydrolase n=1 Tax=Pseudenhygromyxa sp. WMMC2535 TaxID=2712867 RepID=UPI001556BAE9|nr:STM4013/SEN3800 family hydrolase [Pseudenhygromyxa sp. WMMC2535]NVB41096.1 STM4013/SEN3800 family hydrolase [Pseudenhygromyxa sp. WMMC2535]